MVKLTLIKNLLRDPVRFKSPALDLMKLRFLPCSAARQYTRKEIKDKSWVFHREESHFIVKNEAKNLLN